MKRRLAIVLVLAAACSDPIEESVPGFLGRVTVTTAADDCSPPRFEGDGGVQFYGVRQDGGVVFTLSQDSIFGPLSDGGALESVQRQSFPSPGDGAANVGVTDDGSVDPACAGIFTRWVPIDGGFSNDQEIPGVNKCPSGPLWLPAKPCTTSRTFTFTPLSECDLKCLRVSASLEVTCEC